MSLSSGRASTSTTTSVGGRVGADMIAGVCTGGNLAGDATCATLGPGTAGVGAGFGMDMGGIATAWTGEGATGLGATCDGIAGISFCPATGVAIGGCTAGIGGCMEGIGGCTEGIGGCTEGIGGCMEGIGGCVEGIGGISLFAGAVAGWTGVGGGLAGIGGISFAGVGGGLLGFGGIWREGSLTGVGGGLEGFGGTPFG